MPTQIIKPNSHQQSGGVNNTYNTLNNAYDDSATTYGSIYVNNNTAESYTASFYFDTSSFSTSNIAAATLRIIAKTGNASYVDKIHADMGDDSSKRVTFNLTTTATEYTQDITDYFISMMNRGTNNIRIMAGSKSTTFAYLYIYNIEIEIETGTRTETKQIEIRPISGTGSSWSNIARAYDTNGTLTAATVKVAKSTYLNRVGTFNFDLSSLPSNAKITEAILTVNAKASSASTSSKITLYGDIDGDSSKRIINSNLTTNQANYTADVTNYISNWIPSSEDEEEDDTSTTVSLAYGPPSKYLTLCDGIKRNGYWYYTSEESSTYVTTEFIDITNVKTLSLTCTAYGSDTEAYVYAWYVSKTTNGYDKVHDSSNMSESQLASYRSQGYKYVFAIIELDYPYDMMPISGEVLANFTYLTDPGGTGWINSSYPGLGEFYTNSSGKLKEEGAGSTEKWKVSDLFPNGSTKAEFYIYSNSSSSPVNTNRIYYNYWNSQGRYQGYNKISNATTGTENGRAYVKIVLDKSTVQNYGHINIETDMSSSISVTDCEVVVKTGNAVDQSGTSSGESSSVPNIKLTGYTTYASELTLSVYDIVLNIEYITCETKLGNTGINSIYLGQTEISEVYLGTTLVYKKLSSSSGGSGDSGSSGVSEEVLTLYQGSPEENSSTYDRSEAVVSTPPIDITNLKSLTITITQTSDNSVYIAYINEYNANKLFKDWISIEGTQSMLLKSYTLSESDLNNFRKSYTYLGFTIDSNTFWELYPSQLTVTAYYTYY